MMRLIVLHAHAPSITKKLFLNMIKRKNNPNILVITVYHDVDIQIDGNEAILTILRELTARHGTQSALSLYELLLVHVKSAFRLRPKQIYVCMEANLGLLQGFELSAKAIAAVNQVGARTVVFFTGTQQCRQFAYVWLQHYRYDRFSLLAQDHLVESEDRNVPDDIFQLFLHCPNNTLTLTGDVLPQIAILDKNNGFLQGMDELLTSFVMTDKKCCPGVPRCCVNILKRIGLYAESSKVQKNPETRKIHVEPVVSSIETVSTVVGPFS